MTSGSPEEFAEKMKIIAGDNPEIKDYVKSVAKSSKYPVKSMAWLKGQKTIHLQVLEWDTDGEALIPDAPEAPEKPKVFSKEDLNFVHCWQADSACFVSTRDFCSTLCQSSYQAVIH